MRALFCTAASVVCYNDTKSNCVRGQQRSQLFVGKSRYAGEREFVVTRLHLRVFACRSRLHASFPLPLHVARCHLYTLAAPSSRTSPSHTITMSDKIREFAEIPQQFIREGNQVRWLAECIERGRGLTRCWVVLDTLHQAVPEGCVLLNVQDWW
jgi:hypothetical protein